MKGILILRVAFLLFTFSMISNFVSVPQVNLYNISPKLVSHSLESVGSLNNSVKTSSLLIKWSDVWAYYFKEHRAILGIPPDAEVIDVSIMNATFPDPNFHLYFSETFFRCYKVVCLEFQGGFNSRDDTFVNITYIPNRCSFYPVKYDELADTIAPKFLVNYEQAKWWKGFPVLSVNKTVSFMLPSDPKKYIIITKEEWVDSVMPLAKWKENKGLATYIASVEWINRTYMGASLPSKIKEFLKDAYNNWHFDYVVLTGGTNAIPTYYQFETAVPQDWYFVYLDEDEPPEWSRSWDFPEAIIGRLPAKTREELQAIVSKLVSYESNPLTGVWLQTGLEFYSWGFEDDYKFFEQHIVGNLTYKRYIYGYNLTMYPYQNNSFISAVNEGASFIFVDAHGTSEVMEGILNVSPNLIGLLENGPKLPVIFATSCSIAAFDLSPNLASELVSKSQGGAVLFFGKTRIGAEVPIDYQRLHDFLELANFRVGLMAFYARVIGNINPSNHILGDPEMSIWTIEPKLVSVYVPLKVLTGENIVVTITDLSTGQPLRGIVTRIVANNSWIELVTNHKGQVSFKAPSLPGILNLSVYVLFRNQPTLLNTTMQLIQPDITPPVTTISLSGDLGDDNWFTSDVKVTLLAIDDTEVDRTEYSFDNVTWTTYTMPYTISNDGQFTIYFRAIDKAGNMEDIRAETIKIDKTAPVIREVKRQPEGDIEPGQPVKILVDAIDSLSGIKNVTISYSVGDSQSWTNMPATLNVSSGFYEGVIQVQQANVIVRYKITVYDNAGNHIIEDNGEQHYTYRIIPEYPSTLILALFLLTTLIATILQKTKRKHQFPTVSR